MKIKISDIEFGEYKTCLWHTSGKCFISQQPTRFALLEGPKVAENWMYFIKTYLDAKVWQTILKKHKIKSALYADESDGEYDGFFVIISEKELE